MPCQLEAPMGFITIDEHIKSIPNVATRQAPTVAFFDLDGTLIAATQLLPWR